MEAKLAQIGTWIGQRKNTLARVALLVFTCALIVLAITLIIQTQSESSRNEIRQIVNPSQKAEVLILCSYNEADTATRLKRNGVLETLDRASILADIEYLDVAGSGGTYIASADLANSSWGNALAQKIAQHDRYGCVLCIDDDALAYARTLHDNIFADTPLVFAGVSDILSAKKAYKNSPSTGLVETYEVNNLIEAAKAMRPSAKKIVLISDSTAEGQGIQAQVMKSVGLNVDSTRGIANGGTYDGMAVEVLDASSMSRGALARNLKAITDDTILLYVSARHDGAGNTYTANQSAYFVTESASQPVFAVSFEGVGAGFAGSGYIDHFEQGSQAGEVVIQVLNNTSTSNIPLVAVTYDSTVFDGDVLAKYDIAENLVPSSATLLNSNGGLLQALKPFIVPILLLVLAMLCILIYAYTGYRNTVTSVAALVKQRNVFEKHFYTDDLTEMPNMQWLTTYARSVEAERVKSVVEVALRGMDQIGETRGSDVADEVVKVIAERLKGLNTEFLVRPSDNEFILGTDHELEPGGVFLDELGYLLAQPVETSNDSLEIDTCVSAFNRKDDMSLEEMVSGVDVAVHQAEQLGLEDEVIFYDNDMRAAVENKLEITNELRRQIDREQFVVLYQPQVDIETNEVVGFEALARMHDNEYPATTFIPVAEMTGQIVDIDRIVAKKTVQQLARWKKRKQRIRAMSINYASSMRDDGYIDYVAGLLEEYEIPSSTLRFDIKESFFISNLTKANEFVAALHERGFSIALDGFGEGYTSIPRVMQLPADMVKIDRNLTANFLSEEGDDGVIASIVRLVHSAGKTVVIQGVETAEQLARCKAVGCDVVQGFYYSGPLLPERALQYKPTNTNA